MKKLYILINGEKIDDGTINNRCNWRGKNIIKNKDGDFYIPKSNNFDEITIFNFNNKDYVCERTFIGNSGIGSMDFIIHGILYNSLINKKIKTIYYKEFNGNENLDELVKNYEEAIIKKKAYPAWPYTRFKVINTPKYNYNINAKISIKKIISETYELIKDLFF